SDACLAWPGGGVIGLVSLAALLALVAVPAQTRCRALSHRVLSGDARHAGPRRAAQISGAHPTRIRRANESAQRKRIDSALPASALWPGRVERGRNCAG